MSTLTDDENKKMEDLFLAIYFNDVEKVIEFKNQYPEIYAKKDSFQIDHYTTFNLINLTFFNQVVWGANDWTEEAMPFAKKINQKTEQMLDFWRAEFGNKEIKRDIEYSQYSDYFYFYCDFFTDTYEEWLKEEQEDMRQNIREIDIKLMYQVGRFNFAETKKLLEQGAKSDVDLYDDDFSSAISHFGNERELFARTFVCPEFKRFEQKGYNQKFDIVEMFSELLGFAAHEEMYLFLEAYKERSE